MLLTWLIKVTRTNLTYCRHLQSLQALQAIAETALAWSVSDPFARETLMDALSEEKSVSGCSLGISINLLLGRPRPRFVEAWTGDEATGWSILGDSDDGQLYLSKVSSTDLVLVNSLTPWSASSSLLYSVKWRWLPARIIIERWFLGAFD